MGITTESNKAQAKFFLFVGLLLLFLVGIVLAQQLPIEFLLEEPDLNITINRTEKLAQLNGKVLDANLRGKIENYLSKNDNFASLEYASLRGRDLPSSMTLTVGNRNQHLKGIELQDVRHVVDLVSCDWQTNECGFIVNGMPTGMMRSEELGEIQNSKITLSDDHELVVKLIKTDYCDNRRFCNTHYEAYDLIELEVRNR